jgi:hypothetical protein
MDARPLPLRIVGDIFIAAGALALAVSLFLPWYEFPRAVAHEIVSGPVTLDRPTGWQSFTTADIFLLGIALAGALALWLERTYNQRWIYACLALLGWAGAVAIVFSYFRPAILGVAGPYPGPPSIGYLSALCASGAILVGGMLAALSPRSD